MGVDQGLFLVGSYPILGVSITLIAFSLIYSASKYNANPLLLIIPGYIFATLAQLTHPVFIFVPCAFLIFLPIFNKKYAIINVIFIAASYLFRFMLMSTYIYHYPNLKGWVDYSFDSILVKTGQSIDYVLSSISIDGKFLLAMIVLLLIAFLITAWRKFSIQTADRNKILIPSFFLIVAILTYGPTVVIKSINTRYFYAPQLFFMMALILSVMHITKNKRQKYIINAVVILLCASFYANSLDFHRERFDSIRQVQTSIKIGLSKHYNTSATKNDQVVVLVNQLPGHFTNGYNHWSTWFLRYLTGNKQLIGLVGDKKMCSIDPIVNHYKDHGDEYWGVRTYNNKDLSYRLRMKGIEFDRNTYVFHETKLGISPIKFLSIPSNDGLFHIAETGKPFKTVKIDSPAFRNAISNCYIWGNKDKTNLQIKSNSTFIQYAGNFIDFNGKEFLTRKFNINEKPSSLIFKFMLRAVGDLLDNSQKLSDTQPAMPLLADPIFSIYQTKNDSFTFQIKHKEGVKYIEKEIIKNKWQKYELHFDFMNNILYFFSNDYTLDIINNINIDNGKIKSITIGKGYKKRFWKGDLAYFEVYEKKGTEKLTYLNLNPESVSDVDKDKSIVLKGVNK
jgi:hypothetical protein